jgi:spore germination cell wall hydrolase CwlJ-like protein
MTKSIEIMAKTIYGEARGEYPVFGINSLVAVGNVIMNRHRRSHSSIEEICLKPKQFSCWNPNDPNLEIIKNVNTANPIYKLCFDCSAKLVNNEYDDITNGATHYYSTKIKTIPKWADLNKITKAIGNHVFLKLV